MEQALEKAAAKLEDYFEDLVENTYQEGEDGFVLTLLNTWTLKKRKEKNALSNLSPSLQNAQ